MAVVVFKRKRSCDNEQLVERQAFKQTIGTHDRYEPVLLERVYVLLDRAACQVKIGWTTRSVERRRQNIQSATGRKLELVGTMRGGIELERCLHRRFSDYLREGNEWFSSEILADLLPLLDYQEVAA